MSILTFRIRTTVESVNLIMRTLKGTLIWRNAIYYILHPYGVLLYIGQVVLLGYS